MSLASWRLARLDAHGIVRFFYFAHIDNLQSILSRGLLPKNMVIEDGLPSKSFAEESVQERRHQRTIVLSNGHQVPLHDLVPFYLTPKTPTLYARRDMRDEIAFIDVSAHVLCDHGVEFAFTDGNAASHDTRCFKTLTHLDALPWDVINARFWNEFEDGARRRNAEFLIYPAVPIERFNRIVVRLPRLADILARRMEVWCPDLPVIAEQSWFF